METVYEGTWEEVAAHAAQLAGRRVRLIVEEADEQEVVRERLAKLNRALEVVREIGRGKGPYPNYKMDADFFYPDEEERV